MAPAILAGAEMLGNASLVSLGVPAAESMLLQGAAPLVGGAASLALGDAFKATTSRLGLFGRGAVGGESAALRQRVLGNIAESRAARNASYFKIHTHVEDALTLDVRTELDAATFWSGKGNRMLAESYASNLGKTTLEITPGGKYLDSLDLFKSYPYEQAIRPWEVLSGRFAQGASGRVAAFVENASPTSIYSRIENPALQANPNVTEILFSPELEYVYRFGRH